MAAASQRPAAPDSNQGPQASQRSASGTVRYERLTGRYMLQLAAPHTWVAAIMPALVGFAAAYDHTGRVLPLLTMVLLAICVLMQSSVNVLNDYFDFRKGTDSTEDNVEESDAVLVHHRLRPRSVLAFAIGLLVAAFALGILIIWVSGVVPLVIALVGAAAVALYSGGKTPLSYLPLGELVSGVVMGGLIPLACFYVLTGGMIGAQVVLWSVPTIIGVALIMMTNNTCDIEKDRAAGRRTLPSIIGRKEARDLYHWLMLVWVGAIVAMATIGHFDSGSVLLPFMLLASYPSLKALWGNPLLPESRIAAMAQVCTVNVVLGAFYAAAMLL